MKHSKLRAVFYIVFVFINGMTCGRELELCGYYQPVGDGSPLTLIISAAWAVIFAVASLVDRKR